MTKGTLGKELRMEQLQRKVAYYGTLGPSCKEEETLYEMFQEGMTGVRLNLSHTGLKECSGWIENLQNAAKRAGKEPELLIDLQGPELRVGVLEQPVEFIENKTVILGKGGVPIPEEVIQAVDEGQQVLLDDGTLLAEVLEVNRERGFVIVKVLRGGFLKSRKSIAVPNLLIELPVLTKQDQENLKVATDYGVTAVMLPFVRSSQDLIDVKNVLESLKCVDIQLFAKIENMQGVDQAEKLIPYADQMIIARGDLGNAMELWKLPAVQKQLSDLCLKYNKPFMIVTQMLNSMIHAKVPTRAEVSDIYHAVLDGAASLMVTGETAAGDYPVEVMRYLVKTGNEALKYLK